MDYHVFLRTTTKNGKQIQSWYYWFYDSESKKQRQLKCLGCETREEAEKYVLCLPSNGIASYKIKDIAKTMFLKGSLHYRRREQLGRTIKYNTMSDSRRYIEEIIKKFGNKSILDLKQTEIMNYLLMVNRSASWKNQFITALKEIYSEAFWRGITVNAPDFPRFRRKSKKSDIFTDEELIAFLNPANFNVYAEYMLFLLTLGAGLRISEAIAFYPNQLFLDFQGVLINGFIDRKTHIKNDYCKTGSEDNPRWRMCLIPKNIYQELSDYCSTLKQDDYAFKKNNVPYRMEYLRTVFNAAIQRANIDVAGRKLTMHSLRYTYITKMRSLYDIDIVQKIAGHSSQGMTQHYTRNALAEVKKTLTPLQDLSNNFFLI